MREPRTVHTSIFDFYSQNDRSLFLKKLSDRLDKCPELYELVERDLRRKGIKDTGRKGLSVESTFRCMLLKQITRASYTQLSFLLVHSPSYRSFVPDWTEIFFQRNRRCVATSDV